MSRSPSPPCSAASPRPAACAGLSPRRSNGSTPPSPARGSSLTGALKNLLDQTPVAALRDTPVAVLAMGASDHHYLGADRHLRDVLAFFGALVVPTAGYLTGRDFTDGVPGERAAAELDALLAAVIALARDRRGKAPLGPDPLVTRF